MTPGEQVWRASGLSRTRFAAITGVNTTRIESARLETVRTWLPRLEAAGVHVELDVQITARALAVVCTSAPTTRAEAPVIDDLDPGIRRVVAFLRDAGFETTDSGDGVSKDPADYDPGSILLVPHVACVVDRYALVGECHRLAKLLGSAGVPLTAGSIQGSYDPVTGVAVVLLTGVSDGDLP